jgi:hypothetical protein
MSSRTRTATLILIAVLVVVGVLAILEHYGPVASVAPLGISGIIAAGTVLALRRHPAATLTAPGEGDQLVGLRPKSALTRTEWLDVLTSAASEFYIAGHSLGKWCDKDHHELFMTELARILHQGTVTLILLHPESRQLPRLKKATRTDYSANLKRSLQLLEGFIGQLPVAHRARLTVSLLNDPLALPYMLVGNEHKLITATYFATCDSEEVPCLTLKRKSDTAVPIYNDFHALALLGERFAALDR